MMSKRTHSSLRYEDDVVFVQLSQGLEAIVDIVDVPIIGSATWSALEANQTFYAVTNNKDPDNGPRRIRMHRLLMDAMDTDLEIDHIDHNGLNNRRANLRPATHKENTANKRVRESELGLKGVKDTTCGFVAAITVNGHSIHLGSFVSPGDAARAYDAAARSYFGEFACVNFPASSTISSGYFTTTQVAQRLGLSVSTIRRAALGLPDLTHTVGGHRRFTESDINRLEAAIAARIAKAEQFILAGRGSSDV